MKFSSKMEKCGLSPMRKFAGAAAAAEERGINIFHLNIGQPDVATPEAYFRAIREFREPVLAYAPSAGENVLIDAVRGYYDKIGVELERKDVLITSGGSEAMLMIMASILDDGDEIIIPEPFYPNYSTAVYLTGASIRPLATSPEDGYCYAERSRVEACINEHTRAILITNPGNPTGNVLTREELKLMLDIAREHGLFLICDEVYREFVYRDEPLMSALQFEGYEDNVIVIDSVSKRFSACGARIGILLSKNGEFMSQCMKWCQCRLCVATIDQLAAAELYTVGPEYFEAVKKEYMHRRDVMMEKLRGIPGVVCEVPEGAFYVMAALPVDDADKFQTWLLDEFDDNGDTVMFASGEPFYGTHGKGKNEVLMAYVLNEESLSRAMDVLAAAIKKYNETH